MILEGQSFVHQHATLMCLWLPYDTYLSAYKLGDEIKYSPLIGIVLKSSQLVQFVAN